MNQEGVINQKYKNMEVNMRKDLLKLPVAVGNKVSCFGIKVNSGITIRKKCHGLLISPIAK